MTELAVLANIHGVRPALEALIKDLSRMKGDRVTVIGDLINLGPVSS